MQELVESLAEGDKISDRVKTIGKNYFRKTLFQESQLKKSGGEQKKSVCGTLDGTW